MTVEPKQRINVAQRLHWLGLSFTRRDQPWLVVLLLICIAGMAVYTWRHAKQTGGLIDIDRLPRQHAQFQVDLNLANWGELVNLPGVGPVLATEIIDHRQTHGPFGTVEDIQRVNGIGPKKFALMLPHLTPVEPASGLPLANTPSANGRSVPR